MKVKKKKEIPLSNEFFLNICRSHALEYCRKTKLSFFCCIFFLRFFQDLIQKRKLTFLTKNATKFTIIFYFCFFAQVQDFSKKNVIRSRKKGGPTSFWSLIFLGATCNCFLFQQFGNFSHDLFVFLTMFMSIILISMKIIEHIFFVLFHEYSGPFFFHEKFIIFTGFLKSKIKEK